MESLSRVGSVVELLDRLACDLDAAAHLRSADPTAASAAADHARGVIAEMGRWFNFGAAHPICRRLAMVFTYLDECLDGAALRGDGDGFVRARRVVSKLRFALAARR
jgi:hypothetical protein